MSREILTNEQMANADRITIDGGIPGFELMKAAGQSVADVIKLCFDKKDILVLCGPGNNGGDGFVIAHLLEGNGWNVSVACLLSIEQLKGDAAEAAALWKGDVLSFSDVKIASDMLVVDAVFGTGFSREFDKTVQQVFQQIEDTKPDVVAVDIPSGVNGTTGETVPLAPHAKYTVTFCRKKPGHLLMPGAAHCGEVVVTDIGIPDDAVEKAGHVALENHPHLWRSWIKGKEKGGSKYSYGHAVIFGGPRMTGAACMAAEATLRIGAGLCTIVGHEDAADVYRMSLPNIIYEPWANYDDFKDHLADERRNAVLIGPGAGLDKPGAFQQAVLATCKSRKGCVLDADALSVFEKDTKALYKALHENCVLTPHEGEFKRIFPDLKGTKLERCIEAAEISGAVVLLKGTDTTIAHPKDGHAVINTNGPASLATAGSGDVLAGIIVGLLAQHVPAFEAACAAAWIHGRAAQLFGTGLVAPDITDQIPAVLHELNRSKKPRL